MKKIFKDKKDFKIVKPLIIILAVTLIAVAGWLTYKHERNDRWKLYNNNYQSIAARFPSKPILTSTFSKYGTDQVTIYSTYVGSIIPSNTTTYIVQDVTLPISSTNSFSNNPYKFIDSFLYSGLTKYVYHIISAKNELFMKYYPAVFYKNTITVNKAKRYVDGEMILAARTIYVLEAIGPNKEAPNSQYFLNSFQITQGNLPTINEDLYEINNATTLVVNDLKQTKTTNVVASSLANDCSTLISDTNTFFSPDLYALDQDLPARNSPLYNISNMIDQISADSKQCSQDIKSKNISGLLNNVYIDLPNEQVSLQKAITKVPLP